MTIGKVNYYGLEFVPSPWAEYIAMDAERLVFEYSAKPVKRRVYRYYADRNPDHWQVPEGHHQKCIGDLYCNLDLDWRDSLARVDELKLVRPERGEPHHHANNISLYAKDAHETTVPWRRWQYHTNVSNRWQDCTIHPDWHPNYAYRRKP